MINKTFKLFSFQKIQKKKKWKKRKWNRSWKYKSWSWSREIWFGMRNIELSSHTKAPNWKICLSRCGSHSKICLGTPKSPPSFVFCPISACQKLKIPNCKKKKKKNGKENINFEINDLYKFKSKNVIICNVFIVYNN